MKERIVITSGRKYIDIDAYGGIFAYRNLLKELGYDVYAMTSAYMNESIPNTILDLGFKFDEIDIENDTKFIVLDVSNPDFFDTFVEQDKIAEIIDHHTGYEEYWNNLGIKSQIEFIGSICTIIFEKYIAVGKESLLSPSLCKVLIAGILDNTLNLKSKNTSQRDIDAYNKLLSIGKIDKSFGNDYFESCYGSLESNLEESIKNDIKIEETSLMLPKVFGQLIVLNVDVILNNMDKVLSAFKGFDEWIFNVISLEEGKSYLLFSSDTVKEKVSLLFKGKFIDKCLVLDNCMLRKEIIKAARDYDKRK